MEFSKTHKASNVYKILNSSYPKDLVQLRCMDAFPSPMTYLETRKVKHHYKLLSIAVRMFAYIFWRAKQLHVYLLFYGVTLSYIIGPRARMVVVTFA